MKKEYKLTYRIKEDPDTGNLLKLPALMIVLSMLLMCSCSLKNVSVTTKKNTDQPVKLTMFATALGKEKTDDNEIRELIAEKGEDYLCGENGSGLSGGEKQRISIARSLLKKSSILLADEATAALDAQTAWQVSNDILDLEGITRIVVTHSLEENLLKRYDGILVLKDGKVEEFGSFDELMEKQGYFHALYTVSQ